MTAFIQHPYPGDSSLTRDLCVSPFKVPDYQDIAVDSARLGPVYLVMDSQRAMDVSKTKDAVPNIEQPEWHWQGPIRSC